ncbi:hypothetical protein DFH09DRAFT_1284884 [Mycena vulgaris]|nr:hypothetical protein DFH09DRAFT_1284884 [Mycena vulgaris]
MSDITLIPATSPELKAEYISISKTVFVQEQGYFHLDEDNQPQMLRRDSDPDLLSRSFSVKMPSRYVFLLADSTKIEGGFMGTARLFARSEDTYVISRFALLPLFRRGSGNGAKLY